MTPDPRRIKTFKDEAAFERWLAQHHASWPELWIKIHKVSSGLATVTPLQAIDVCLCWGWIDGQRKGLDERSFLQRYTPRGKKSLWSQINRDNVARLTRAGRMQPSGQREVDAAKADGRWDAAYAPMRDVSVDKLPADLRAAIAANPRAEKTLATLDKTNLFSLTFRVNGMRTPAGREKKIAALVATLASGKPIVPPR
ncbi:MAG TPA: YdeI/OmpD-associated family protein [Kofleriaceae bacterium]|nr:YdeI/OmpD-associated family protein [Kofleriaceae bacterium]